MLLLCGRLASGSHLSNSIGLPVDYFEKLSIWLVTTLSLSHDEYDHQNGVAHEPLTRLTQRAL